MKPSHPIFVLDDHIEDHQKALGALILQLSDENYSLSWTFTRAVELLAIRIMARGKILICGNGGSAADAEHLATEFAVRYCKDRKAIPALSLTSPGPLLTAAYNDGYEVFARQVEAYGRPGDILIAISTSGHSQNVIQAIYTAKRIGMSIIGLTGRNGFREIQHPQVDLGIDVELRVPSDTTSTIQEMHILLYHALVDALERELNLIDAGPDGRTV